jgi:hypothetical protein
VHDSLSVGLLSLESVDGDGEERKSLAISQSCLCRYSRHDAAWAYNTDVPALLFTSHIPLTHERRSDIIILQCPLKRKKARTANTAFTQRRLQYRTVSMPPSYTMGKIRATVPASPNPLVRQSS